jgi:hypothetical protein
VSKRSRVLLICSVLAIVTGTASLIVGLASGRMLQALPVVAVGLLVPSLYLRSRRAEQSHVDGGTREG